MKAVFTFVWTIAAIAMFVAPVIVIIKISKQHSEIMKNGIEDDEEDEDTGNSSVKENKTGEERQRMKVLQPTLKETDHDDSSFIGSLGDVHDEGFDPCHSEQMKDMEMVCKPESEKYSVGISPFTYESGDNGHFIGWDAKDISKGFVVSEVINRKQ